MEAFIDIKKKEFYESNSNLLYFNPYPYSAAITSFEEGKIDISIYYLIENPIEAEAKLYKRSWEICNQTLQQKLTIKSSYEGEILLLSFSPSGKSSILFKKELNKYSLIVNKYNQLPSSVVIPEYLHQIAHDNIFGHISWSKDETECTFLGFKDENEKAIIDPLGKVTASIYYLDLMLTKIEAKIITLSNISYPSIPLIYDSENKLPGTEIIIFFEIEGLNNNRNLPITTIKLLKNFKGTMPNPLSLNVPKGLHLMPCLSPDQTKLLFFTSSNEREFVLEVYSLENISEVNLIQLQILGKVIYSNFSLKMIYNSKSGFIDNDHFVWNSLVVIKENDQDETIKIIRMVDLRENLNTGQKIKDIPDDKKSNFKIISIGNYNILALSSKPIIKYYLINFNPYKQFSHFINELIMDKDQQFLDPKLAKYNEDFFWKKLNLGNIGKEILTKQFRKLKNQVQNNNNIQYSFDDFRVFFYPASKIYSEEQLREIEKIPIQIFGQKIEPQLSPKHSNQSIQNSNQKLLCIIEDEYISNSNYFKLFFSFLKDGYNLILIKDKNPILLNNFHQIANDASFMAKANALEFILCNFSTIVNNNIHFKDTYILYNFGLDGLLVPYLILNHGMEFCFHFKGIISCNNSSLNRYNTSLTLLRMSDLNLLKSIYNKYLEQMSLNRSPSLIIDNHFNYSKFSNKFLSPFMNFSSNKVGKSSRFLDMIYFIKEYIPFLNFPSFFIIINEWNRKWIQSDQIVSLQQNDVFRLHEYPSPYRIQDSNYLIIYSKKKVDLFKEVGQMIPPKDNEVGRDFDPNDKDSYLSHNENQTIYQTSKLCIKISGIPLEKYHSILLPHIFKYFPQRITQAEREPLNVIMEFILHQLNPEIFYIFFNSFAANVRRNHFHMQLLSTEEILHHIFGNNNLLAIQKVKEIIPIENNNLSDLKIQIYSVKKYPIPHFKIVYQGNDANDLTNLIIQISKILNELTITFHLMITSKASEIYFIPRKHQNQVQADIEEIKRKELEEIQGKDIKKIQGKDNKSEIFCFLGRGAYELCGNGTTSDESIIGKITTNLYEEYLKIYAINDELFKKIETQIGNIQI